MKRKLIALSALNLALLTGCTTVQDKIVAPYAAAITQTRDAHTPEEFATWRNVNETILTEAEAAAVTSVGRDIYSALRDLLGKGGAK